MCDQNKLMPEYAEWLRRCQDSINRNAWAVDGAPYAGVEFGVSEKPAEGVTKTSANKAVKKAKASLEMSLAEGVCDGCGAEVKHQRGGAAKHPALYKFTASDGRHVQVCYKCFRKMSDGVTFAYGE